MFNFMKIALILFVVATILSGLTNAFQFGNTKAKDETIQTLSAKNDTLVKALRDKPTTEQSVNYNINKLKSKNGGSVLLESKPVQTNTAGGCDTVGVIRFYRKLKNREQRRYE
jgi:hypothetical protein